MLAAPSGQITRCMYLVVLPVLLIPPGSSLPVPPAPTEAAVSDVSDSESIQTAHTGARWATGVCQGTVPHCPCDGARTGFPRG